MQTLDAKTVPLTGTNLIEASAGTGKTWTISWLYLRLVAVCGLRVDQILVVTYTEAATAELRDRIRKRLADALAFLEKRTSEEPYETLLEEAELPQCIQRLQLALVSFDEAAVFTIHGFCKRVLTENAFEARLPFESELVTNEDSLLTELTDKFWYQHFLTPDTLHLNLLQKHNLTPDNLLATVRPFIGKPYLHEDIPAVDAENFAALQTTFNSALQASQETWATERAAVLGLLLSGALNGSTYRKDYVQKWAEKLDAGLGEVGFPADILARFTPAFLREKTKAGKATPSHAFFSQVETLLAAYTALHTSETAALEYLRLQLLHHLRRELPIRKQQLGILTFDDLLLHLNQALEQHADFSPRLAAKYRAALIDEFQDTDPIQYAIFGRIYCDAPEPRVFYVGDPKQAIYGFRGADIYTYLQAAQTTEHKHTLGKNFRSHPDLLKALNHLFKQSDDPFRSAITYEPVEAGKPQADIFLPALSEETPPNLPLSGEGQDSASPLRSSPDKGRLGGVSPLRLWNWDSLDEHNATQVEDLIAEATADDIARLLTAGQQGIATVGDGALQSKHIAVLVRTGKQGERVRQALLARGISSVQKSRDSIFRTCEAAELRAVLRAIAEPGSESALKQALVTELFAYSASQLYALDQQPALLETELEAFHAWHKVWHTQGFMPMFRQMLRQRGLYAHLLAFADGERRLTNLLHLAELIHTESRLHGHGMHALIRWLQQRASSAEEQDAHQLRLESDANLVQIVTIHKSKGLEYGVVYCPYLWQERDAKARTWFSWYDDSGEEGKSRLQADSLADDVQRASFWEAERAENLRLLYVALTRAKYHCTVALVSGLIPKFDYYSALGWLLFGGMPQHKDILGKALKGGMPPEERQTLMQQRLQEVVDTSDGGIGLEPLPVTAEPIRYQPEICTAVPETRHYHFTLPPVPKVGSFSGLAAGKDDEKPDYDVLAFAASQFVERSRSEAGKNEPFPRGAQAGSCLHKMLEELDFMQPLAGQREKVLIPALQRHGMAERWSGAVERLLDNALNTPLQTRLVLSAIPKSRRLDELEFYFPVTRLRLKPLQRILHQHLPAAWTDIHAAIDKLKFNTLTGYMKGFVDLVFEAGGCYFIVDYKSNELGSTADDYTPAAMQQAMAEHHYYLQYLIYCLALHRYLRQRIQHYAWETYAGGALYLFLRGMQPSVPGSGVFFHKPDAALIDALDDLMQA